MLEKEHKVISAGSCTINCLVPVVKVLYSNLGIKSGFMTTIHAYTNDQNVLDGNHKDLRRARACGLSMVPTTTEAAKTIGSVIPELKGKLDGTAIRVPVSNVSMVDFKFTADKKATVEEINEMFKDAALFSTLFQRVTLESNPVSATWMTSEGTGMTEGSPMSNVLSICEEPLVSIDFVHNPYSAVMDLTGTYVTGDIYRVAAWYDNEWAFSLRMLDIALLYYSRV
jgi:glyceraldehyde 3-phosphate dehydrogenase